MQLRFVKLAICGLWLMISVHALATPPAHVCANEKRERVSVPLYTISKGKLLSLIGRKLRKPVQYKNGTYYNVDLLPSHKDVYQFPYPGELYIQHTKAGKRITHNHHVYADGRYAPDANGWWILDIDSSGTVQAMGFNETNCFFSYVYIP